MKKQITALLMACFLLLCGCSRQQEPEGSSAAPEGKESVPASVQTVSLPESSAKPKPDIRIIPDYQDKYFVQKLDDDLLEPFIVLYQAALEHQEEVSFETPLREEQITTLMFLLNYDCPELIHVSGDYYPHYNEKALVFGVRLVYCMTPEEYASGWQEVEAAVRDIVAETEGMSDYDKEKTIYDRILKNAVYDEPYSLAGSLYGTLIQHRGRREGFCKTFMWCARRAGLECLCVSGPQYWDPTALYADHSWNIVRIDGEYYHLDLTVDHVRQKESDEYRPTYGYFNVDDTVIAENREVGTIYQILGVPPCTSMDKNYHRLSHTYIGKDEPLEARVLDILEASFQDEKIEYVSIRFEEKKDYQHIAGKLQELAQQYLQSVSDGRYTVETFSVALTHTLMINAYPKSGGD